MSIHRKTFLSLALSAGVLLLGSCAAPGGSAEDAAAALARADAAMGTQRVDSLRFSATGTGGIYGQAFGASLQWPRINYSAFSRLMDYRSAALREEFARSRAEPNGGGAIPLMGEGEQRAVGVVQGNLAWNAMGPAQVPSPVALDARIHDLWTSPHGVLKAAARNNASASTVVEGGQRYTVLRFSEPGRFSAQAFVNEQGLVDKVVSRLPHPVMADSDVTTWYSDYRDHGGVKFPARIRQSQDGGDTLNLQVAEVQVNPPADIAPNDVVRGFAERATSEQAAPGVWFIAGGSHNSVVIEMRDHLILVESPLYDGRAAAVIAEAKRLAPGKPIRFVINSHHHFDHTGGIRAAAADGATVLVSQQAVPFFQQALARPSTIRPDLLAQSGRRASVEGVGERRVLTDGSRSVEIHQIKGGVHADGFVMVHLPAERLLIQADAYTPLAPGVAPPARPNGNHVNLIENIERLRLPVDRLLPLHGRIVPLAELYATAGRRP